VLTWIVVYKNIFDEQKYAEIYRADDAEREMNLGHNAFVALAMLLGSDYTEGVKGVGIVNAMEVLESFDVSRSLEGGLEKFKKWLDGFDLNGKKAGDEAEMTKEGRFRSKHKTARKNWVAPQNFPAQRVMKAYLEPVVDKSRDRFSWGAPDVESLAVFCRKHIGWRLEDTKRLLDDAISKRNAGLRQTRIDSFMHYEHSIKFAKVRSKRLRDVLGLPSDSEKTGSSSKSKKRK
jgi:DNA excision repair protein ERCC-5